MIIPCYNVAKYIERCLDSVYSQTYESFEVIIVDNNSTDDTLQVVEQYLEKNIKKATLLIEKNQGAPFARNTGLSVANGTWIQFLDADDELLPNKLSHQISIISLNSKKVDVLMGATVSVAEGVKSGIHLPHENISYALLMGQRYVGSTCSNLWSREKVLAVGSFNTALSSSQEVDLMCRMFYGNAIFIRDLEPLTLIHSRSDGKNISSGYKPDLARNWIEVRIKMIDFLVNTDQFDFNKKLKAKLLKYILISLGHLAEVDINFSHTIYHNKIWPLFKSSFFYQRPLDVVKNILYHMLGFKNGQRVIQVIKKSY